MGMQIIHQSQHVIWMPVIYHRGNILITLWCNSSACEIRFTVEHQFCQKLQRDHHRSPLSGEYCVILLDSLTIRPWIDHGSNRNVSGTLLWLICSCHSVFLGTSSSSFIYIFDGELFIPMTINNYGRTKWQWARLLRLMSMNVLFLYTMLIIGIIYYIC